MLNIRHFQNGLQIVPRSDGSTAPTAQGDFAVSSVDGKVYYNDGTIISALLTEGSSGTITNKTLDDSTVFFVDTGDNTKQLHFDAAGTTGTKTTIATSQTANRVLTLPDATDTLVGRATTDTLTNKSISGSTNTITNVSLTTGVTGILPIANGGTNASTKTTAFDSLSPMTTGGDIIYGGASGTGLRLANGSNGQVLTSSGGTSAPTWMTPSPGFQNPMTTIGDIIIGDTGGTAIRLGATTNGFILTLVGGSPAWVTNAGGSAVQSIGTINSQSKSANGLVITGTSLVAQTADATFPGMVSTGAQTLAGAKTFSNALTLTQVSTPSTPSVGNNNIYFKSDGFLYTLDSNGTETLVSPGLSGTNWKNDLTFTVSAGFGTITNSDFRYRRVGDTMEVIGTWQSGSVAGSSANISLPGGFTFDSTKAPSITNVWQIGTAQTIVSSGSPVQTNAVVNQSSLFYDGSDTSKIYFGYQEASNQLTKVNANGMINNNDTITVHFSIPITGWTVNNGVSIGGNPMTTLGDIIIGGAAGAANRLGIGTTGQVLTVVSGSPAWAAGGSSNPFDFFTSSQVTTNSSGITSTTFATFSTSPTFTLTPNFTGTYKVYCSAPINQANSGIVAVARIFETSAVATLLSESQASTEGGSSPIEASLYVQSIYTLTSGTPYQFDIQGKVFTGSGTTLLNAGVSPFYMYAERVG